MKRPGMRNGASAISPWFAHQMIRTHSTCYAETVREWGQGQPLNRCLFLFRQLT
jgi:hypothetical protein